jgi:hypothetical protein
MMLSSRTPRDDLHELNADRQRLDWPARLAVERGALSPTALAEHGNRIVLTVKKSTAVINRLGGAAHEDVSAG